MMELFCFSLEEDGMLTECEIKTQEAEDMLDFNFNSSDVVNKIILKVRIISLSNNIRLVAT